VPYGARIWVIEGFHRKFTSPIAIGGRMFASSFHCSLAFLGSSLPQKSSYRHERLLKIGKVLLASFALAISSVQC